MKAWSSRPRLTGSKLVATPRNGNHYLFILSMFHSGTILRLGITNKFAFLSHLRMGLFFRLQKYY